MDQAGGARSFGHPPPRAEPPGTVAPPLETRERARLARELHDHLGQLLTSAALLARAIERDTEGPVAERAARLRAVVEEATAATRDLASRLRAPESGVEDP